LRNLHRVAVLGPDTQIKMSKPISVLAVLFSAAAIGVALFARPAGPVSVASGSPPDNAALAEQVGRLEKKLTAVEDSQRRLLDQLAGGSLATVSVDNATVEQLKARLTELDRKQTELDQATKEIDKLGIVPAMEAEVKKARATLMDESLPVWERAKQAALLKRFGQFDAPAVEAMMKLLTKTENPNEKAGVIVALTGQVSTELRDQILLGLRNEAEGSYPSPKYRYVAIEALQPMRPDPLVEQWLAHLAQHDPEPEVQARAARSTQPPRPAK
jgi:hypothetical protein